ncbi:tRNA ligase 1-like [Triticum dicoccoides]|nr:tRNA ligase 1-like [Triticum dicoccoides]
MRKCGGRLRIYAGPQKQLLLLLFLILKAPIQIHFLWKLLLFSCFVCSNGSIMISPLPGDVKTILDEVLSLFIHGRAELLEGWAQSQWEKRLREILFGNADYLKSIQVPFEVAVKEVVEQLKAVAKGDTKTPDTAKRRFGNIIFAAVTLSQADILGLVHQLRRTTLMSTIFLTA